MRSSPSDVANGLATDRSKSDGLAEMPVQECTCVVDQHVDAGAAKRRSSACGRLLQLLEAPQQVEGQHTVLLTGGLAAVVCHCLCLCAHWDMLQNITLAACQQMLALLAKLFACVGLLKLICIDAVSRNIQVQE